MSALAISSNAAAALPGVTFHSHHRGGHGARADAESVSNVGQPGQLPVGIGQGLMSNLVQSLQQTLSGQSATAAGGAPLTAISGTPAITAASATATGTPANANIAQDLQGFMHALFQALNAPGSTATATPTATAPASGGGQYQAGLASSLQSLIQQVSAGGTQRPVTANLTASFNQLKQDLGANGGGALGSGAASNASLQNFLSGFLQSLHGTGHIAPALVGGNVNAQV
jgi:hypothetical protein